MTQEKLLKENISLKMKRVDLLPLIVMAFFSIEMALFVVFVIKSPIILIAYIPLVVCIFILIILHLKKGEVE
jgi:predicted neutral ceramidase superfamily lipid hydrolase